MDQNGNQPKSVGERLAELANKARAQDQAELEARKLGYVPKSTERQPHESPEADNTAARMTGHPEPAAEPDDVILTSAEAAKLLKCSEKGFRNAVSQGKIPCYRFLGQNRFKKSELMKLLIRIEPK